MHPAVEEIEELVLLADLEGAKLGMLSLLDTQIELATGNAARQFKTLRSEAILHASQLSTLRTRKRKGIDETDRLEREERRLTNALVGLLEEIDAAMHRIETPKPTALPRIDASLYDAIPEKVYGRGSLQSVAWLAKGTMVGKAVCRIVTPKSIGTGFLLQDGRVITNNHVVPTAQDAAKARVEFNFERDSNGVLQASTLYRVRQDGFLTIAPPWDCTVMTLDAEVDALAQWGHLQIDNAEIPSLGEPVTIIQHPNGGEKQVALTANEIVAIKQEKLAYLTDTLSGSSGAPVFNASWKVIALHRAGGGLVEANEGKVVRANEGVLFRNLLEHTSLNDLLQII